MKSSEAPGRHLTPDEVVERVFPSDEHPAPVPLHLAACPDCQEKVSQLREGWLLDRNAVGGFVQTLPDAFWNAQSASVLAAVAGPVPAEPTGPIAFVLPRSILRRPALAFGSLAAALALVAVITYQRFQARPDAVVAQKSSVPAATAAAPASEEIDRVDDELLSDIDELLADEGPLASLVPEGVS
jgi:hypothetical protein